MSVGGTTRTFLEDGDEVVLTACSKVWCLSTFFTSGLYYCVRFITNLAGLNYRGMVIALALESAQGRFSHHYLENVLLSVQMKMRSSTTVLEL